jgi:hypothetical protein
MLIYRYSDVVVICAPSNVSQGSIVLMKKENNLTSDSSKQKQETVIHKSQH